MGPMTLKRPLQSHCINNRCQHSHIIALNPVYTESLSLSTAKNISTTNDNGQFDTLFFYCFYLLTILIQHIRIDIGGLG